MVLCFVNGTLNSAWPQLRSIVVSASNWMSGSQWSGLYLILSKFFSLGKFNGFRCGPI